MRKKITVVGAGNVGATAAQRIVERGYADVVLVDIIEGLPQGKGLDLLEAGPVLGYDSQVTGTNSYEDTVDSDIVVVTAGIARKPGMSRDDLLFTNMKIVGEVTRSVVKHSPDCILIVVSNPLDAMAHLAYKVSKFPRERVIGMAGILDTARFRTFLAQELGVSVRDVSALVLGGHGDTMVPLVRLTTVGGVPVTEVLPGETIEKIVQRTRDGGAEIVKLLKTGSAFYAPSAAIAQMVDAIVLDRKQILPCTAYLQGEFGIEGLYIGVPVKLGAAGIEEIVDLRLTEEEQAQLNRSADAVRQLLETMRTRDTSL
jgi:malate dehydrogenase